MCRCGYISWRLEKSQPVSQFCKMEFSLLYGDESINNGFVAHDFNINRQCDRNGKLSTNIIGLYQIVEYYFSHVIEPDVVSEASYETSATWSPWHNDRKILACKMRAIRIVYNHWMRPVPPSQKKISISCIATRTIGLKEVNDKVIEWSEAEVVVCVNPLRSIVQVKDEL